jgi:Xaa-Pro aminopeptidase
MTPRNFPANSLSFRQDSSFWYFSGCTVPGSVICILSEEHLLFLPEQDPDDELWHGHTLSNVEIGMNLGFTKVLNVTDLPQFIASLNAHNIQTIAIGNSDVNRWASKLVNTPLTFGTENGSKQLIRSIISMRRVLDNDEIEQLRWTSEITRLAHINAMRQTKVKGHEREIAAAFHYPILQAGLETAYHSIVTTRGEVLHNHLYTNSLKDGDLLLLDGGAESPNGYATDVTRTWPVNGRFNSRQSGAYEAVLQAQTKAISMVRPGARYLDIHTQSCLILAEYLFSEGLLKIPAEDAVEMGAHAIFFPHGLGHLLGLDVHDMENFGDIAAYASGRNRSQQFGTAYLRMDMDLIPNMVVMIEPGLYIVPAIIHNQRLQDTFKNAVNWSLAEQWIGFGGIRIEDDIRCTESEPENFSALIPKSIQDIESLVGQVTT